MRRDLQHRLDAALEQLSDLEQAAVWAATAAARSSSGTVTTGSSPAVRGTRQNAGGGACDADGTEQLARPSAAAGAVVADVAASGGVGRESARREEVQGWQLACLQVAMQHPTAMVSEVRGGRHGVRGWEGVYGVKGVGASGGGGGKYERGE
jgi:hypothetical protein